MFKYLTLFGKSRLYDKLQNGKTATLQKSYTLLVLTYKLTNYIFMNRSGSWAIHGPRLAYLQGSGHEAVYIIPRMGCAVVDALRSARLEGKNWRLKI